MVVIPKGRGGVAEVDALVRDMDPGICSWYLDLLPHIQGMQVGRPFRLLLSSPAYFSTFSIPYSGVSMKLVADAGYDRFTK